MTKFLFVVLVVALMTLFLPLLLRHQTKLPFVVSVVALITVFTGIGAYTGFYLSASFYAMAEPIVYPCPNPGNAGACAPDLNQPPPAASVWYYNWPSMDPTHIHYQPQRACIFDFLYHDPFPPGSLRGERQ